MTLVTVKQIMKNMFFFFSLILSTLSPGVVSANNSADQQAAQKIVEEFQNELIATMQAGQKLGFQGRYQQLESAIKNSHDLVKIARIVVGREWKQLSEEQQTRLVDAFSHLSVSTYAYNFKQYDREQFKFLGQEETTRGGVIIHSVLLIPSDKDVKFDYMLKKKGDKWKIINIIANGVSDLALRRSEYTSVLKRQGFEALIDKIDSKSKSYAEKN